MWASNSSNRNQLWSSNNKADKKQHWEPNNLPSINNLEHDLTTFDKFYFKRNLDIGISPAKVERLSKSYQTNFHVCFKRKRLYDWRNLELRQVTENKAALSVRGIIKTSRERFWQSKSELGCRVIILLLCVGNEAIIHVLIFVFDESCGRWQSLLSCGKIVKFWNFDLEIVGRGRWRMF